MKLLELAGYGMEAVGAVVGALYTVDRYTEQIRKDGGSDERPSTAARPSGPGLMRDAFSASTTGDEDIETDAKELVTTRSSRFADAFWDLITGWLQRLWIGWRS